MTPEEQRAYDEWLQGARPALEAGRWAEAMQGVPTLKLEPARPRPLAKPLSQSTVALVTSAGLAAKHQPPLDGPHIEGDYTIRLLDLDEPLANIVCYHTHFDTAAANEDLNVVYPIDRLKELAAEGVIGRVAPRAVSFMGYFSNVFRMRDEVVPAVVEALQQAGAEAAVLVPV